MENLNFYPKLTSELKEACGLSVGKYIFTYFFQDNSYGLKQKGTSTIKLSDPLEIWKIENEGISFSKTITIAYPRLLYGVNGIACQGASLGICIMWTNKTLTQTGCILPESDTRCLTIKTCCQIRTTCSVQIFCIDRADCITQLLGILLDTKSSYYDFFKCF